MGRMSEGMLSDIVAQITLPGLSSVKQITCESFSKTILHLLNNYYESVSCDLQLESSCYFSRLDVISNKLYKKLLLLYRIK